MSSAKRSQTETEPSTDEEPIPLTRPRAGDGQAIPEATLCPGLKLVAVAGAALLPRALSKRLARFEVEVIATTPAKATEVAQDFDDATVVIIDRHVDPSSPALESIRGGQLGRAPIVLCDLADAVASQDGLKTLFRSIEPVVVGERRLREALQMNRAVRVPIGVLRPSQLLRVGLDTSPWTLRASVGTTPIRIEITGQQLVVRSESTDEPSGGGHSDQLLEAFLTLRRGEALFLRRTSEVVPAGASHDGPAHIRDPESGVTQGVEPRTETTGRLAAQRRRPSKPTLVGFLNTNTTDPDRLDIPGVVEYTPTPEEVSESKRDPTRAKLAAVANHKPTELLWQPGSDADPVSGAYPRPDGARRRDEPSGAVRVDRTGRRSTPAYGPQSELLKRRESRPRPAASQRHRSVPARKSPPPKADDRWWEGKTPVEDDEPLAPLKLSGAYRVVRALVVTVLLLLFAGVGYGAYLLYR